MKNKIVEKSLVWFVRICVFILPLFFLPVIGDSLASGKMWFALFAGTLGLVLWFAGGVVGGAWKIRGRKELLVGALFLVLACISLARLPAGAKTWGMISPYGIGMFVAMWLWYFLFVQTRDAKGQLIAFSASLVLLLGIDVVTFLLPTSRLPIVLPSGESPWLVIQEGWTLLGSLPVLWMTLVVLALMWGWELKKASQKNVLGLVFFAIFILGVLLVGYQVWQMKPQFLNWLSSWVIAVEAFKRSPLFGVGPGNYLTAFNLFRPMEFNQFAYWTAKFGVANSAFLQLWTEIGFLGFALVFWVFANSFRRGDKKRKLFLVPILLAWLFLPISVFGLLLTVWLLALGNEDKGKDVVVKSEKGFEWGVLVPWAVILMLVGVGMWGWWVKGVVAEVKLRNSVVAAAQNRAVDVYNMQGSAIKLVPSWIDLRIVYSQTNLGLAQGILASENLTDEQKNQAITLIGQAIDQAKAATNLDPNSALAWRNLADLYKAIMPLVEGAQEWALATGQQAISRDLVDPALRLDLGGIYYSLGQYQEAAALFEQAIRLKNDWPNAWYNWAYAARQMGNNREAVLRMQQVLALLPIEGEDYQKAWDELSVWKKELEQETASQSAQATDVSKGELELPKPMPTVSPVVELPESAGPEIPGTEPLAE